MRVGGGGSFLRVGGKRTENYEREGGRSRRLYLRSLRSMAANRLPFPLSFLLAFPPFSSSISKNQHYLLFVSPFAAFHLSPSPNRSIARGREFRSLRFLRLRLSFSLSIKSFSPPFSLVAARGSWNGFITRHRCLREGNVAIALRILSFSGERGTAKVLDNKRNRLATVVFRSRGGE